jgi:ferric-dicitrate binding protein FerR (iron transport regulator)
MAKHVEDLLTAYVHGELHGVDLERVEHHLRDCRECRAELQNIRSVCQALGSAKVLHSKEELWSRVDAQLAPTRQRPFVRYALVAAAGVALLAFWTSTRPAEQPTVPVATGPSLELLHVNGAVTVASRPVAEGSFVRQGEALCTGPSAKTRLAVADVGEIELSPDSELQLVASSSKEHRMRLTKGELSALVVAPPRFLVIETPAGEAVDLGCAYTLKIDEQGNTVLNVTSGWVALEREGPDGMVPSGWTCTTRKKEGVGTPVCGNAPTAVAAAFKRFDLDRSGPALSNCLRVARKDDALSVWHLLTRTQASDRRLVYEALAKLSPPPVDAPKQDVLALESKAMDAWRESIMWGSGAGVESLPFDLGIFR